MSRVSYYKHIRSLGAFPAVGAWKMAKDAEDKDKEAYVSAPAPTVAREVLPDGSGAIHLSFGISVF